MNTPPAPQLLLRTVAEAAEILGKSEYWVRTQARKGTIPHRRIGVTYRFTDDDLNTYISSVAVDPWVRGRSRRAS
jgi:excisionase family DNA binding protein